MTTQDNSGTHATLADSGANIDSQELPRGSNLGRYVIIEPIGSGGMGTVYRAYDPQLNRGVALKILSVRHADLGIAERAKARLIREAQALAQLSHPNVVAVHDAGTFADDVFIAMELVEGKTLDDWMKGVNRSVKEILGVMIAAGRGLSAAHKAGLVHRDFKPGNVIVGDDSRVRVLDFGLARTADQEESGESRSEMPEQDARSQEFKDSHDWREISSDSSPNLLQSPLTHAGGILGTPMYMAPEQHLGLKTDERTDQFGFCVVLYEALYGRRPFSGSTLEKLKSEVVRQQVCVPRPDSNVPTWLWKIVYKGLSAKPEDRYATIDLLLEDLDKDPEEVRRQKRLARRRKMVLASLIVLTVALPIGVWYGLRYRTFQLCKAADSEFDGVWDNATKTSSKKAFLNTKKTYAPGTWERVERTIDRYTDKWRQMRGEVCEARLIRGTQSEELFDLRMSCLRKRVRDLNTLMEIFAKADSTVVQKAVQASESLTDLRICADEEALRAPYPPPKTAETRDKVAVIREGLAEVEALFNTGKFGIGLQLANRLEKESKTLAYQPVQAEAMYWHGYLFSRTGDYAEAEKTLDEAARLAGECRHALLAVKAMTSLVWVVGYKQARHKEGLLIARDAEILLGVAAGGDIQRARLFSTVGVVFGERGNYDKALQYHRRALAIRESMLKPEHPNVLASLNNLGTVFYAKGDYDKALEYYQKVLFIRKKTLAPGHPKVASVLYNMGMVFFKKAKYKQALDTNHQAVAIWERAVGPMHPHVARPLDNIGSVYLQLGEYDKAIEFFQKAAAIFEQSLGANHVFRAFPINSIGQVLLAQGRYKQALSFFQEAVAIWEKSLGRDHNYTAIALIGFGQVYLARKQYRTAIDYFSEALNVWEKKLGTENPQLADALQGLGFALLDQGKAYEAIKHFERLASVCRNRRCEPNSHARGLFGLACALVATNGDKENAVELALKAKNIFGKTPKRFKKELEEVNTWLQKHGEKKLAKKAHK